MFLGRIDLTRLAGIFLTVTFIPLTPFAQDKERPVAHELLATALVKFDDYSDRQQRVKFINTLSNYCKEFLRVVRFPYRLSFST